MVMFFYDIDLELIKFNEFDELYRILPTKWIVTAVFPRDSIGNECKLLIHLRVD